MRLKLLLQAMLKFFLGVFFTGFLLFLSAGTLHYPQGWLFMGLLFIPMFLVGMVLLIQNPTLLEKRLDARESEPEQRKVIGFSGLMFVLGFVLAGLDFRFRLLPLPHWVTAVGSGLFLLSYLLYGEVVRENTYLSRTVEIQENQKVIDTGLYAIVRHPMYSATLLLFLSIPLILGSMLSLCIFLVYPLILVARIRSEEAMLSRGLAGYAEYMKKVRYRLIPGIW